MRAALYLFSGLFISVLFSLLLAIAFMAIALWIFGPTWFDSSWPDLVCPFAGVISGIIVGDLTREAYDAVSMKAVIE